MFIVHPDEEKEGDVDLKLLMIRTLIREDCCDMAIMVLIKIIQ